MRTVEPLENNIIDSGLLTLDSVGIKGFMRSLFALTKPTIGLLVVVTMMPSLFLASEGIPSLTRVLAALIGTYLASCSAAALNHVVDSEIDRGMRRTRTRPVASGKVSSQIAVTFAVIVGIISFAVLMIWTTQIAAWLAVAANAFYVLGYTMYLKRRTWKNIVIGGAAGAVGPLIGWAAINGDILHWMPWALFTVIFLWTPPHFWALALKYKDDYGRAGIPMLPVIFGDQETRRQIYVYTLLLVPVVGVVHLSPLVGRLSLGVGMGLTLYFLHLARRLYLSESNERAMALFHYSCFYLFGVFGAMAIDRLLVLMA